MLLQTEKEIIILNMISLCLVEELNYLKSENPCCLEGKAICRKNLFFLIV